MGMYFFNFENDERVNMSTCPLPVPVPHSIPCFKNSHRSEVYKIIKIILGGPLLARSIIVRPFARMYCYFMRSEDEYVRASREIHAFLFIRIHFIRISMLRFGSIFLAMYLKEYSPWNIFDYAKRKLSS